MLRDTQQTSFSGLLEVPFQKTRSLPNSSSSSSDEETDPEILRLQQKMANSPFKILHDHFPKRKEVALSSSWEEKRQLLQEGCRPRRHTVTLPAVVNPLLSEDSKTK